MIQWPHVFPTLLLLPHSSIRDLYHQGVRIFGRMKVTRKGRARRKWDGLCIFSFSETWMCINSSFLCLNSKKDSSGERNRIINPLASHMSSTELCVCVCVCVCVFSAQISSGKERIPKLLVS